MARYLVTYHGSEMSHDPEAIARAREAFVAWADQVGTAVLVDQGTPVVSRRSLAADGVHEGAAEGEVLGWSVVEAPSPDAAVDALREHPFLTRGGVLQVCEPPPG